jgi:glycine dehydrogenase subunit 2
MRNEQATQLIFELSRTGRQAVRLPDCDVPQRPIAELLPQDALAANPPPLPQLS